MMIIKQLLLDRAYGAEELCDIERDVLESLECCCGEPDEHGFVKGSFKVTVEYTEELNDN